MISGISSLLLLILQNGLAVVQWPSGEYIRRRSKMKTSPVLDTDQLELSREVPDYTLEELPGGELTTVSEASEQLGLTLKRVKRLLKCHHIPVHQVGRDIVMGEGSFNLLRRAVSEAPLKPGRRWPKEV
jgi:excisionase family DNA binding protein